MVVTHLDHDDDIQKKPWWAPDAQTLTVASVIFMTAVALFYRMRFPTEVNDKLLDMMLTLLFGTAFVGVVNYQIGSSRSSQSKDAAQNKVMEKLTGAGNGAGTEANRAEKAATAATAAAALAAPAAAAIAAPPAAAEAAPPVVEKVVPPAVKAAVDQAMEARTARDEMQKLSQATAAAPPAAENTAPAATEKAVNEALQKELNK